MEQAEAPFTDACRLKQGTVYIEWGSEERKSTKEHGAWTVCEPTDAQLTRLHSCAEFGHADAPPVRCARARFVVRMVLDYVFELRSRGRGVARCAVCVYTGRHVTQTHAACWVNIQREIGLSYEAGRVG